MCKAEANAANCSLGYSACVSVLFSVVLLYKFDCHCEDESGVGHVD